MANIFLLIQEKVRTIIDNIKSNKVTAGLIGLVAILLLGGIIGLMVLTAPDLEKLPVEEVELDFDPQGPYAILNPRSDGNALVLNLFRVSEYKKINYELVYSSLGSAADEAAGPVDRGATGLVETKDKKNEYRQEILFGTCSQGFTSGNEHCIFDKGVENGTLALKIEKTPQRGDKKRVIYKMLTTWHLQRPDVSLGEISSGDAHFVYKTDSPREELSTTAYSIVNDLTGAPKLPEGKQVTGKVYALNVPNTRNLPKGMVTIELSDDAPQDAKIYRYIEGQNKWMELDTKTEGSMLKAESESGGIFAVLINNDQS